MLLNYDDQGPGPLVLLLHGFPFDHTIWSSQITKIGAIYRVIAPDLRGHGKSAAPEGIYTMDEMADDVIELLDALQIDGPVVIAGHSMGGYVALSAVLRYPERFRGLMLIDSKAKGDTPEAAEKRLKSAHEIEANGETSEFISAMIPRLFAEATLAKAPGVVEKARKIMTKTNPRALVGALRGMARRPERMDDLSRIGMPTLVMTGEFDVVSPPDEASEIVDRLANGRLKIISGAGHMAPIENEPDSTDSMLRFLNEIEGI